MLFFAPLILFVANYFITSDAYMMFDLPSRYFHKREISSWKCAQQCFNRLEEVDYSSSELPHNTRNTDEESTESQIAQNLKLYCEKSDDELSCLRKCADSDEKRDLLVLGLKVKDLACSNLKNAVKTYNCVLESQMLSECVAQNCKDDIRNLKEVSIEKAQRGHRVIPGQQFCSLEVCTRRCMKKILPLACGQHSFSLYTSINDMANFVQILTAFESKPRAENGILCIDRPIPDVEENSEDDEE